MFNTTTFFGSDGRLSFSGQDGFDTELGKFSDYFPGDVGRVINVSLFVSIDVRAFHELGSHATKELRAGNIYINGTVERAYINGALLKLMLGQNAEKDEATPFKIPSFTMGITLKSLQKEKEGDEGNSSLTIYGVMFDSWQYNLPEDNFVLEKLSFKGKRIELKDNATS